MTAPASESGFAAAAGGPRPGGPELPAVLDTGFRRALGRLDRAGMLARVSRTVDTDLEIAATMKHHDADAALLFENVKNHEVPVVGNVFATPQASETAMGLDRRQLRAALARGIHTGIEPETVPSAPAQERVWSKGAIDLGEQLPVLRHTASDGGRFVTAAVLIVRDPLTSVRNASFHRLQLVGPDRVAVKIDHGRHLGRALDHAAELGRDLPVAACIGTDLALIYAASTMGALMPESRDELCAAGGCRGRGLAVTPGLSQDVDVPACTEIVLEGSIRVSETVTEGPFGEFVGYASPAGPAPVIDVTALTTRDEPVYHAINGAGRETIVLRKHVLEVAAAEAVRPVTPIVSDVALPTGGLHRFHLVMALSKRSERDDGMGRNAALAAFGALKDLNMIVLVDDDIDLHDPVDVEYALATRFDAASDLVVLGGMRGHEYVRTSQAGIGTKVILDASVPFERRTEFERIVFSRPSEPGALDATYSGTTVLSWLPTPDPDPDGVAAAATTILGGTAKSGPEWDPGRERNHG